MTCPTGKRVVDSRAEARAVSHRYPGTQRGAHSCDTIAVGHPARWTRPIKHGTTLSREAP